MTKENLILVFTVTTTALMAGIFFAFSCSVSPGLNRLPDADYMTAMQSINREIQNPLFFVCFFGAPVLLLLSAYLHFGKPQTARFQLLFAASVVYLTGALGVTILGNIPLNNTLDQLDLLHTTRDAVTMHRAGFETSWNTLNNIRSIASTGAVMLVAMACLKEREISLSK